MGKRVFSDISKFKAVEASLRAATNEFRTTIERIDTALNQRRSDTVRPAALRQDHHLARSNRRRDRTLTERWRRHYNQVRPHSSLGYRPPAPEVTAADPPSAALRSDQQRDDSCGKVSLIE